MIIPLLSGGKAAQVLLQAQLHSKIAA